MATIELLKERLSKLRQDAVQAGQVGLTGPAVLIGIEASIYFLLAAVMTGGIVFGTYAPFGVAMVAGAGTGLYGGFALLGAGLGYLTLLGFADGLRYLSVAVLTFAIGFAFNDIAFTRRLWTMPTISGILMAVTGYIYFSQTGWRTEDVIYFMGEILLTVYVGWACRMVLMPIRLKKTAQWRLSNRRLTAIVIMLSAVLLSLNGIFLWQDITVGRVLAVVAVISVAWRLGPAYGAVLGVSVGLALDIAGLGMPLYAMTFGASALAAGAYGTKGKYMASLGYLLASGASVIWTWEQGLPIAILYESFFGILLFMAIPLNWFSLLDGVKEKEESGATHHIITDKTGLSRAKQRLEGTATAFRSLCDCLRVSIQPPENINDVATVFDRAACRVCKKCALCSSCWERDYVTTFNALNDATAAMVSRGRGEKSDFPVYFSSRCLNFTTFLESVNSELTALLYRRQYNSRIRESRTAVCRQYAQLSSILGEAATELGQELVPDGVEEHRLSHYFLEQGLEIETAVFRDHRGMIQAELTGENLSHLVTEEGLKAISNVLNVPMGGEVREGGVTLNQREPLMAVAGVAARKKDGETISGDAGSYFKGDDGILYLLLCDGMGSGEGARRESNLALRLLEQFLRAGVRPEQALITLSSALGLRGEETGGFTTVDLLQVNLFTGEGAVYKLGGAPSYVKKRDGVRKITGVSLPAGLEGAERNTPDFTRIKLEVGDCVLMISDGVAGTEDDTWIKEALASFSGDSPKELAKSLVSDTAHGGSDDKTALVVRLAWR